MDLLHQTTSNEQVALVVKHLENFPSCNEEITGYLDIWWIIHDGGLLMLLAYLLNTHRYACFFSSLFVCVWMYCVHLQKLILFDYLLHLGTFHLLIVFIVWLLAFSSLFLPIQYTVKDTHSQTKDITVKIPHKAKIHNSWNSI